MATQKSLMFKNSSKKKWIISGVIILLPLNFLAFYLLQQTIGIQDALEHVDDQNVAASLQQKSSMYTIFTAVVITLDLVFLLFIVYLLFKMLTKSLKNPNQS